MGMTFSLAEIAAKIDKLEKLAEKAGTPEEAALALGKAAELMENYQITRVQVDTAAGKAQEAAGGYGHQDVVRLYNWQDSLIWALCADNHCEVVHKPGRKATYYREKIPAKLDVIGHRDSVRLVLELYAWFTEEVMRLSKAAFQNEAPRGADGFGWQHSYRNGFVAAVAHRLSAARMERREAQTETQSNALMVLTNQTAITKQKIYPKLGTYRSAGFGGSDYSGREAGRRDGRTASLTPVRKLG